MRSGSSRTYSGVRLRPYVAEAILGHGEGRFLQGASEMRDHVTAQQSKRAAAAKAGKVSEADALQAVALTPETSQSNCQRSCDISCHNSPANRLLP